MKIILTTVFMGLLSLPVQAQLIDNAGLKAFEKTLYVKLRKNCIECHSEKGRAIAHSSSNVEEAYTISKDLVDFNDLDGSLFTNMVAKKHWLKINPDAEGMSVDDMILSLRQWWDEGEAQMSVKYSFVAKNQNLPKLPDMASGAFTKMTWDLGTTDPTLTGCKASLEVQRAAYPDPAWPGAYRVQKPTLSCVKAKIDIDGVFFAVSGEIASYENIYSKVKMSVPENGVEVLLSKQKMILIQRQTSDTLSFVVRTLIKN